MRSHYTHGAAMTYNSLNVPLDIDTWQCTLVPANEYYGRSGYWDAFASWSKQEKQRRQIEDDCRTFERYFRPAYDFRRLITTDIEAITSFLRDHLNVAHWNLPTDNAGIGCALKRAVADGKLVPIVQRERRFPASTFRPAPAPLRWPPSGGAAALLRAEAYVGGVAAIVSGSPFPVGEPALSAHDHGDGLEWFGVAEAFGGTVGAGGASLDIGACASTPLGDAQPFEYAPTALSDYVQNLAARGVSAAQEAECDALYAAEMDACRVVGAMYRDPRTYALCSQRAFQNYQNCRGYK